MQEKATAIFPPLKHAQCANLIRKVLAMHVGHDGRLRL
jgi:hypothetical protein